MSNWEWLVALPLLVFGDRWDDLVQVTGLLAVVVVSAAVILGVFAWADRPEVQR